MPAPPSFSVITPSRGDRPRALAMAVASVERAAREAFDERFADEVELLVGFDGARGERPDTGLETRFVDFPRRGEDGGTVRRRLYTPPGGGPGVLLVDHPRSESHGNLLRQRLINVSRGRFLVLLDDDNILTPEAFAAYLPHLEHEMIVARIDTSRAFDVGWLPRPGGGPAEAVRQGNIDPLCVCLSRDLVERCGGWQVLGGYESDFLNLRRYFRRARSAVRIDDLVGVYDAGRGLDSSGQNPRQRRAR